MIANSKEHWIQIKIGSLHAEAPHDGHIKQRKPPTSTRRAIHYNISIDDLPEMSESTPEKRSRANSKGEELYLIHLKRTAAPDPHPEDAEDDHDYEVPRHPKKTIGEELFEVHLKRSKGLEPDYDVDPEEAKGSDAKPAAKVAKTEGDGEKPHYNLRNRKAPASALH